MKNSHSKLGRSGLSRAGILAGILAAFSASVLPGCTRAHEQLLEDTESDRPEVRARAIQLLGQDPWANDDAVLIKAASDTSSIVRQAAAEALHDKDYPQVPDVMASLLEDKIPEIQEAAVKGLLRKPTAKSVASVRNAFVRKGDDTRRIIAAQAPADMVKGFVDRQASERRKRLWEDLDSPSNVRQASAMEVLARSIGSDRREKDRDRIRSRLMEILASDSSDVVVAGGAMEALAILKDWDAVKQLVVPLLNAPEQPIREAAIHALGTQESLEGIDNLLEVVSSGGKDALKAVESIGRILDANSGKGESLDASVKAICAAVPESSPDVAGALGSVLARRGVRCQESALMEALNSSDGATVMAVLRYLQANPDASCGEGILKIIDGDSPWEKAALAREAEVLAQNQSKAQEQQGQSTNAAQASEPSEAAAAVAASAEGASEASAMGRPDADTSAATGTVASDSDGESNQSGREAEGNERYHDSDHFFPAAVQRDGSALQADVPPRRNDVRLEAWKAAVKLVDASPAIAQRLGREIDVLTAMILEKSPSWMSLDKLRGEWPETTAGISNKDLGIYSEGDEGNDIGKDIEVLEEELGRTDDGEERQGMDSFLNRMKSNEKSKKKRSENLNRLMQLLDQADAARAAAMGIQNGDLKKTFGVQENFIPDLDGYYSRLSEIILPHVGTYGAALGKDRAGTLVTYLWRNRDYRGTLCAASPNLSRLVGEDAAGAAGDSATPSAAPSDPSGSTPAASSSGGANGTASANRAVDGKAGSSDADAIKAEDVLQLCLRSSKSVDVESALESLVRSGPEAKDAIVSVLKVRKENRAPMLDALRVIAQKAISDGHPQAQTIADEVKELSRPMLSLGGEEGIAALGVAVELKDGQAVPAILSRLKSHTMVERSSFLGALKALWKLAQESRGQVVQVCVDNLFRADAPSRRLALEIIQEMDEVCSHPVALALTQDFDAETRHLAQAAESACQAKSEAAASSSNAGK